MSTTEKDLVVYKEEKRKPMKKPSVIGNVYMTKQNKLFKVVKVECVYVKTISINEEIGMQTLNEVKCSKKRGTVDKKAIDMSIEFEAKEPYKEVTGIFLDSGFETTIRYQNVLKCQPYILPNGTINPNFDSEVDKISLASPYDTERRQSGVHMGMLANKTIPSKDTTLYNQWDKLVGYCQENKYELSQDVKCYASFLNHARHIQGYDKQLFDDTYRLVIRKDIEVLEVVDISSLLFISDETWQNEYKQTGGQDTKPVLAYIYNTDGKRFDAKFRSQVECEKSLGISQPEVSMAKRKGHTVRGGTGSEKGWRIVELEDLRKLKEKDEEFLKQLEEDKDNNYYKELSKLYQELESDDKFFKDLYEFLKE